MKLTNECTQCKKIYNTYTKKSLRPFCSSGCYGAWQSGKCFAVQGKKQREKKICQIKLCSKTHFGRDYCKNHYYYYIESPRKIKVQTLNDKELIQGKSSFTCNYCNNIFHCYTRNPPPKFCSIKCSGIHKKKPFIIKKGYKKILDYNHHRADKKGYVFEHIVVMERHLKRPILRGEEIHHVDHDRGNNSIDNLMLFPDHKSHMKFHSKINLN